MIDSFLFLFLSLVDFKTNICFLFSKMNNFLIRRFLNYLNLTLKDIKWMYKSINMRLIAIKIPRKTTKIAKNKQHVHTFFRLKMIKMIMHYGYWGHWLILSQSIRAFYFWEFNGFHMSAVILLVYRQLFD
jgi:hypothetical protein